MNTIEKVTKVLSEMKFDFAQVLSNIIKGYKKFSPLAFGDVKLPEVDDLIIRKLILDHRGHLLVYKDIDNDEYKNIFGVNLNTFLNNRADYYFTFDQQCYLLNKIFKCKLFANATDVKEFDDYTNYERRRLHEKFNVDNKKKEFRHQEKYEYQIDGKYYENDHSEIKSSVEFDFQYNGLVGELTNDILMYHFSKGNGEYQDTTYFNEDLMADVNKEIDYAINDEESKSMYSKQ